MKIGDPHPLPLDYGAAASDDILRNLSCAALAGGRLWTVADEGRTLEELAPAGDGYRLKTQHRLDDLFGDLLLGDVEDEIDLEAMAVADGRLWLCGSHCRVRRKPDDRGWPDARFRRRPSRHFFGALRLASDGGLDDAQALPATGLGSVRRAFRGDPYLAPYLRLPSKEGGLDIEGMAMSKTAALLGLRGPVIDGLAVVAEIGIGAALEDGATLRNLHFLDLGGLGVRGMARIGRDCLIIGGPVADAPGPFRLYAWRKRNPTSVQQPECILAWPDDAGEKPEGLCPLAHDGSDGLLVLFDSPAKKRIEGQIYLAEWRALAW